MYMYVHRSSKNLILNEGGKPNSKRMSCEKVKSNCPYPMNPFT